MRFVRRLRVPFALALPLVVSACGDDGHQTATGTGGGGGAGGGGGGGAVSLSFPQFVRSAARVDAAAFAEVPLVIAFEGDAPDGVEVKFEACQGCTGSSATVTATRDGDRFVASKSTAELGPGAHPIVANALRGSAIVATVNATLTVGDGSLQLTDFAKEGPGYATHLALDAKADAIDASWVSAAGGPHGLWFNELDGAFARLHPKDVALADPADEPLDGHTAFGADAIGVVYRTAKPGDVHWLVKMRVVDRAGAEVVKTMDLTEGEAAFSQTQAGLDPGGFSAAWLHISPPNPNPPPVEVRFSRWDTKKGKLVGPITIDQDQPAPSGGGDGPQTLEPLGELGIACNDAVCVVTYTRDVYIPLVDLNVPKVFAGVVDLATGQLAGPPKAIEASDWDTQLFGHHLITLADGTFQLVYTANDTAAAVNPKSPCDQLLERDLLFAVKLDAKGDVTGTPKPIFDFEGSREFPRLAPHPAGFALFWEDQRSECSAGGHIRMAFDVTGPDLASLLDPYLEVPGSVGLPPEDPSLAVTGTNFVVSWSDNRHGMGLLDPKNEVFLDTYWRK